VCVRVHVRVRVRVRVRVYVRVRVRVRVRMCMYVCARVFFLTRNRHQALMWKCLHRQQQDELRFARALATQHLTAHLLRYNFTHRHSLAKSASSHLCAATRAAVQRRKHTFQHAAATTLEARVRATTARLVWVQRWGAGRELCAAVCRHQLRNVAVLRIQTIRAGACVVAGAWRIRRAKNALRNSLRLREEEDAQQQQLAACAAAAMCLQTCMRRVALQGILRRRVLSATLILGAHQRNHARRGLTVAMEAAAILNRRARAAVLQVQMTSMMTAARCLAARLSARCARCDNVCFCVCVCVCGCGCVFACMTSMMTAARCLAAMVSARLARCNGVCAWAWAWV